MMQELLQQLEQDALARLRWRVLRQFSVLPGSAQDAALTDAMVLRCGLHMVLDKAVGQPWENPQFALEEFLRRKAASCGE